jgi:hypothetical protein
VKHVNRICHASWVHHAKRTCLIPNPNFFHALSYRRHRFEIVRLFASLHTDQAAAPHLAVHRLEIPVCISANHPEIVSASFLNDSGLDIFWRWLLVKQTAKARGLGSAVGEQQLNRRGLLKFELFSDGFSAMYFPL